MPFATRRSISTDGSSGQLWITVSPEDALSPKAKSTTYQAGTRVCDNCVLKKRKCELRTSGIQTFEKSNHPGNLGKPRCSACQASNLPCAYTSRKKKPGPLKGWRHNSRQVRFNTHDSRSISNGFASTPVTRSVETAILSSNPIKTNLAQDEVFGEYFTDKRIDKGSEKEQREWPNIQLLSLPGIANKSVNGYQRRTGLSIEIELHLLDLFFQHIQLMYPLFRKSVFFEAYSFGLIPESLKTVMLALAARYSTRQDELCGFGDDLDEVCASFAVKSAELLAQDSGSNDFTLDQVKTSFLLCIYHLTLSSDRKAWTEVGQLTRIAHICGLDQIEGRDACIFYKPGVTTDIEMEEWRHLWWNIWRLDSVANSLNSSPCSTDTYVPGTALVSTSPIDFTNGDSPHVEKTFLDGDIATSWKSCQIIFAEPRSRDINIYTLAFTLIREASALQRLARYKSSSQTDNRLLDLDKAYAAIRLALPAWYSNPAQCVVANESQTSHSDRLKALLILSCARLMALLCTARLALSSNNLIEFQGKWQCCLSCSQEIVYIIQHFDPSLFSTLDPLIAYISWLPAVLFSLEVIVSKPIPSLALSLTGNIDLCILFLKQISCKWKIGRVLACSLETLIKNKDSYTKASYEDFLPLLSQLEMPLNRNKRQHLRDASSSASNRLDDADYLCYFDFDNLIFNWDVTEGVEMEQGALFSHNDN